MITITRRQARRLRAVFRRNVLGIGHRGSVPPLVIRALGNELRAEHWYAGLGVVYIESGVYRPVEAIALPLDALADCEGRDEAPIVLEAAACPRPTTRPPDCGWTAWTRRSWRRALDRLPGGDDPNAPVTLNLNGRVSGRAHGGDQGATDRTAPEPFPFHRHPDATQCQLRVRGAGGSGSGSTNSRSAPWTRRSCVGTAGASMRSSP